MGFHLFGSYRPGHSYCPTRPPGLPSPELLVPTPAYRFGSREIVFYLIHWMSVQPIFATTNAAHANISGTTWPSGHEHMFIVPARLADPE